MSDEQPAAPEQNFADLGLAPEVLKALADVGYETPSQIQANHPMPVSDYLPVALMKLLLHPLLVLGAGWLAIALGAPLSRFALVAMTLTAALPSASNVSLLAERMGADNGRIARIILVTTAAAFLSFSGAVALLA